MYFILTFFVLPTSDSYKRYGVTVLRCYGWEEEKKRGGELVSSEKGCIFAGRNKAATIMEENQKKAIIEKMVDGLAEEMELAVPA